MSIEWEFNLNLDDVEAAVIAAIPKAMLRAMEHVRAVVTPMVPVETGNLAGSGDVKIVGGVAELKYPGPYALYQHNSIYYRHGVYGAPLKHNTGEPFFLLRGMVQANSDVIDMLESDLKKAM